MNENTPPLSLSLSETDINDVGIYKNCQHKNSLFVPGGLYTDTLQLKHSLIFPRCLQADVLNGYVG